MPSPIGHALAGAAIAFATLPALEGRNPTPDSGQAPTPSRTSSASAPRLEPATVTVISIVLAAFPDVDLLGTYTHRTITHSFTAVVAVAILAAVVTAWVTGRARWRLVALFTAAYASHLLLDWLAEDNAVPRGLQLLWPFSDRWFISGWDVFRGTARQEIFSLHSIRVNALAIAQELIILGPVVWLTRLAALRPHRANQ